MNFGKLRIKIAGWILGDQTALFLTKDQTQLIDEYNYLVLDDDKLGKMFRRSHATIIDHYQEQSKHELRPFTSVVSCASVLFLANLVEKANAETADITIAGSLDGGQNEATWAAHIYKVSNKKVNFDKGIVKEYAPDDPERLTALTITFENPGYHQWVIDRKAARENVKDK